MNEWICVAVPIAAFLIFLAISVPIQASRRGQGFIAWLVLELVTLNLFYPMLLVALLPNKARSRLRGRFKRELEQKLAGTLVSKDALTGRSAAVDQSIGNLATTDPGVRSIGDIETQG